MSDLTKEAAYIKGLFDGMKLDADKAETKILKSIIGFLEKSAEQIDLIDQEQGYLTDQYDDLEYVVNALADEMLDDVPEDEGDYQVKCESCGADIMFSENEIDDLLSGRFTCPECGEIIEIDLDMHDDECGCGHDHE
ncbi:MAG TPA: phage terminase large subunit family protein [Candidatus Monoglobus merdigallinarum]|uniref:Phage terminase large subunit family protein n=1 Tax=Candidatus Monoglobus merdigallinarum TaxID=2838698 RepID=A0A9D1PRL5_9FIRM|nr:phage terminase large subunit family protein [Candidatus Monoglobus merdigallinarum]